MAFNTIKLKKYSGVIEEMTAYAVITPGMLVKINSVSPGLTGNGEVLAHSTVGGIAAPIMFALEDELQGKGIDDDYVAGDQVQCWIPYRGDQVYAILNDGQSVVIGDFLVSSGEGFLNKLTVSSAGITEFPEAIVAVALEQVDLSGSSGVEDSGQKVGLNRRIRVRIV